MAKTSEDYANTGTTGALTSLPKDNYERLITLCNEKGLSVEDVMNEALKNHLETLEPKIESAHKEMESIRNDLFK